MNDEPTLSTEELIEKHNKYFTICRLSTIEEVKMLTNRLQTLTEENKRLRESLEKYGKHWSTCFIYEDECRCGLSKALKASKIGQE